MKNAKARKSNFELMRISSMILIIIWHVILHGKLLDNSEGPFMIYYKVLLYIAIIHVNSFIVLTGYFQSKSKFKLSKLLSLILEVIFYSVLVLCVSKIFNFGVEFDLTNIIKNLLPSAIGNYWFISAYIIVYLFSDYINKFINSLSKKEFRNIIILMFLVLSVFVWISGLRILDNTGYNFYHFIFMYLIGAYLRMYPLKESYYFKRLSMKGYKTILILGIMVIVILNISLFTFAHDIAYYNNFLYEFAYRILSLEFFYSAPLVIIQTVFYFELFKYMNVKSSLINYLSSCTFGIYLLHDNIIMRNNIYHILKVDTGTFGYSKLLYAFATVIIIFGVGIIVESIRKLIFYLLNKTKIVKKIKGKVKDYFTNLNFEINW